MRVAAVVIALFAACLWSPAHAQTLPTLAHGQAVAGQFDASDKKAMGYWVDMYRVSLAAGQLLTVAGESDTADLYISLTRSESSMSTPLAVDGALGGERTARLQYMALAAGQYVVKVFNLNKGQPGAYHLKVTVGAPVASPAAMLAAANASGGEVPASERARVEALRTAILSPNWRPALALNMGTGGHAPMGLACGGLASTADKASDLTYQSNASLSTWGVVRYRGPTSVCFPRGAGVIDYADGSQWVGDIGPVAMRSGMANGMPRTLPRPAGFGQWRAPDGSVRWLRIEPSMVYPWGWEVGAVLTLPAPPVTVASTSPKPAKPKPAVAPAKPVKPSAPPASPEIERLRREKAEAEARASAADAALRAAEQAELKQAAEAKARRAAEAKAAATAQVAAQAAAKPAAKPTPPPARAATAGPRYGQWVFFQSDKALQYRVALVKQEGDLATLRYQFRVAAEDAIHCRSAQCEGYLLEAYNFDPDTRDTVTRRHLYFPNGFTGVFDYPDMITVRFKQYDDSRSWWDEATGLPMYAYNGQEGGQVLGLIHGCADNKLAGTTQTRCRQFDFSRAVMVQ